MATFQPDDKFFLRYQSTGEAIPGEFSAKAVKARAVALSLETGQEIGVYVVGSKAAARGEDVATAIAGEFLLSQPHDEDGNSLEFQPWPGDEIDG